MIRLRTAPPSQRWRFSSFLMPAWVQEAVTTNRMTDLRAAPEDSARDPPFGRKPPMQTLQRRGALDLIKVGMDTGWVRMMHLRGGRLWWRGETDRFDFFLSIDCWRLCNTNQRAQGATLGIRGFSKEDVARRPSSIRPNSRS